MTRPHDGATERLAFDVDAIRNYFPALSDRRAAARTTARHDGGVEQPTTMMMMTPDHVAPKRDKCS